MAVVMALKSFIALEGQLTGCTPFAFVVKLQKNKK